MLGTMACLLMLAPCAALAGETEHFFFEHTLADGVLRSYAARIDRPGPDAANGRAVLLLGGGLVTDMDWTVPGSVEQDGETLVLTSTGEATRDAETIGRALVDAGFVVMRWSSVHRDDPVAREAGAGAGMPIPFEDSVALGRAARDAFRARSPEARTKLAAVAHSLGAPRAAAIVDDGFVALVFLAGAYTSRTEQNPSALIRAVAGTEDPHGVDPPDFDGDGVTRDWERAAQARLDGSPPDAGRAELRPGVPWPVDVLESTRLPLLAVYGGVDPISVHAPWLERFARQRGLNRVRVEYRAGLGHQLGTEENGRIGPIDPRVVALITGWLVETIER
jgi:hypothetical protein